MPATQSLRRTGPAQHSVPARCTTSAAPLSSAPQISNVAASNDDVRRTAATRRPRLELHEHRSRAPGRTTARCGTHHALRRARRPRRVDHVGACSAASTATSRRHRRLLHDRRPIAVQAHAGDAARVQPRRAVARCVTSTGAPASASMNASRSPGRPGRAAGRPPPAFRTASTPTTRSAERSRHSATTDSGPTPSERQVMRQPIGPRVQLAVASGSRPRTPPPPHRGSAPPAPRTAPAASRAWQRDVRCRSIHQHAVRSAGDQHVDEPEARSGSDDRRLQQPHKSLDQRLDARPSNRSTAYSRLPTMPAGTPSAPALLRQR